MWMLDDECVEHTGVSSVASGIQYVHMAYVNRSLHTGRCGI